MRALPALGMIDSRPVYRARLVDGDVSVTILSLGCITSDWRVAGQPVVLGFDNAAHYLTNPAYFGAIVGRVANRTAGGRFTLDGHEVQLSRNEGAHHLHGGIRGLGSHNWTMAADGQRAVCLSYRSPDGEEGYPGAVDFTVTISLAGHALSYDMEGLPDRPTPINLAQHSYYNLAGGGPVWDHRLLIAASGFTPTNGAGIPTGEIAPIAGSRYDFRRARTLADADPARLGSDINLVLDPARDPSAPSAKACVPGGMRLRLWSDQPGLQLYDAMHLGPVPGGHDGETYDRFHGLCLEPQHFPDALHHASFPPIICTPERPYRQRLTVAIAPAEET